MRWIITWIERGWVVVVCGALALAAYLQAEGLSQLLAAEMLPERVRRAHTAPVALPRREVADATPILRRNPFDSVTGPLDGVVAPPPSAPEPSAAPADPLTAPKCDFGYVTLIVTGAEGYSFAALKTKDGESHLGRVGDSVDDHRIVDIASRRVWFDGSGARCQLRLNDDRPAPVKKARRARKPKKRSTSRLPGSIADKIEKISDTEYRIDRSALDEILEQQAKLMRGTRIRPKKQGGDVVGMRVSRVRNGTLLDSIGIRTGDIIKSINGFDLTNPQKALEAYGRLQSATELKVEIERGGKPVTLEYQLI